MVAKAVPNGAVVAGSLARAPEKRGGVPQLQPLCTPWLVCCVACLGALDHQRVGFLALHVCAVKLDSVLNALS